MLHLDFLEREDERQCDASRIAEDALEAPSGFLLPRVANVRRRTRPASAPPADPPAPLARSDCRNIACGVL